MPSLDVQAKSSRHLRLASRADDTAFWAFWVRVLRMASVRHSSHSDLPSPPSEG